MPTPVARWRALRLMGSVLGGASRDGSVQDWANAVDLARDHAIAGAFAAGLRDRNVPVSDEDRAELDWIRKSTIARALRMRAQAHEVVATLNARDIEPLLMKGSLLLLCDTLPDLGVRVAADLDVVAPRGGWEGAVAALESVGYIAEPGRPFAHPHELPFVHPDRIAPVELHASLGGAAIDAVLPARDAWADATLVEHDGARFWALSPEHQIAHNIAHTQLQDLNHAVLGVPIRQLHTFSMLVEAYDGAFEWSVVECRLRAAHALGAYDVQLALASILFGARVPRIAGARGRRARARAETAIALASVGPVSDVVRNVRYALGPEYLDSLYHHGGRRGALALARVRHLWHTGRSLGREGMVDSATRPVR